MLPVLLCALQLALAHPAAAALPPAPTGHSREAGEPPTADPHRATVRALYAVLLHAEWPRYRHRDAFSPLVVGVLGDPDLARSARTFLTTRRAHRRPLQVVSFPDAERLGTCHLLYVGECAGSTFSRVQAFARGRQVLLAGPRDPRHRPGLPIAFYHDDAALRIEIDRASCNRTGVRLTPQLLALSRPPAPASEGDR